MDQHLIRLEQLKRPDWDTYFLNIAQAVAHRSTCLRRRYGAVIVKDRVIVSTGYNGAAKGAVDCLERGTCPRIAQNIPSGERYELCVAVHAEANAIISAARSEMEGATIYIAGINVADGSVANATPCMMCDRMISNAGIVERIYYRGDHLIKEVKG